MRNRVYFIGGSKGTGKSSLTRRISELTGIAVINTGDFFSDGCSKEIAKKRIICSLDCGSSVIADTHYAAHVDTIHSGIFERALSYDELVELNSRVDLIPYLIDLDPFTLYERRVEDKKNERDLNLVNITKDLNQNRLFFRDYCEQIQKNGLIIYNQNFEYTIQRILSTIFPGEKQ